MAGKRSVEAGIREVDAILASVGLEHGRRASRKGSWKAGERTGVGTGALREPERRRGAVAAGSVVQVPALKGVKWLRHGFSTRLGGFSQIYGPDELNLGWTAQDEPRLVVANRDRFVRLVAGKMPGKDGLKLVTVRQVHSGVMRVVEKEHGALVTAEGKAVLRGDGLMTDIPGLLLGVQTADCVPVLVVDTKRKVVAAFHAGWRGTLARIVERGVGTMRLRYGSRPGDLIAVVGPSIGPCCYAVGEEVRHEFTSQFAYAEELFSEVYDSDPVREKYPLLFLTARAPGHSPIGPQLHVNLWEANRRQLLDAGLKAKNVTVVGECSACATVKGGQKKYFSHRGEHGFAGRMMSVVGVVAERA